MKCPLLDRIASEITTISSIKTVQKVSWYGPLVPSISNAITFSNFRVDQSAVIVFSLITSDFTLLIFSPWHADLRLWSVTLVTDEFVEVWMDFVVGTEWRMAWVWVWKLFSNCIWVDLSRCPSSQTAALSSASCTRARNEGPQRFDNHGEGPY